MDEAITGLRDLQLSKLTAVGAYTLFLYDILLTLAQERQYIWKARWSLGKALFLIIRWPWFIIATFGLAYGTLAPSPSQQTCRNIILCEQYASIVELGFVQFLFALRTFALYGRNKRVGILLFSLPVLCVGTMIFIAINYLPPVQHIPSPIPEALNSGCYRFYCSNCDYGYSRYFWVPLISFDGIIFLFTVYKAWQYSAENIRTPILTILYRDGFLYFLAIFAGTLTNLIIWNTARVSLFEVFVTLLRSFIAIMSCRLILNLRGALFLSSARQGDCEVATPIVFRMVTFAESASTVTEPWYSFRPRPFDESSASD